MDLLEHFMRVLRVVLHLTDKQVDLHDQVFECHIKIPLFGAGFVRIPGEENSLTMRQTLARLSDVSTWLTLPS